ncbi:hypothetical protein [Microbacterium sp. RU33B]|uniref:hypothetical protein n=1 Tax=Microbacterium sp. RU33B TaxID=1907390 RepID=UPI00095B794D|nr:hypothetical protein [Microbacterium sp. RU33B]SIT68262.1 hypothetical protein SAMN05880545_0340 [Microbacterium sp. RU33B]
MSKNTPRKPDTRCFVQTGQRPSIGVEVSSGRAWVGVDRQIGHGSADALFALTDEQYPAAFRNELGSFEGECWRGEHGDLLLFDPGTTPTWRPECWHPLPGRAVPPRFAGELWRHVDALGTATDSNEARIADALAAGRAIITEASGVIVAITLRLTGEGAHPRPAALISGLTAGSDLDRARSVIGGPIAGEEDVFAVEGHHLRLVFVDDGLVAVSLTPAPPRPAPDGRIRDFLDALGEPEHGTAYLRVAQLAGSESPGRAGSVSTGRLVEFDGGVDVRVDSGRVVGVRLRLAAGPDGTVYRNPDDLISGLVWPASRVSLLRALGAPASTSGGRDLFRYGARDLVVEYDRGLVSAILVSLTGARVSFGPYGWSDEQR